MLVAHADATVGWQLLALALKTARAYEQSRRLAITTSTALRPCKAVGASCFATAALLARPSSLLGQIDAAHCRPQSSAAIGSRLFPTADRACADWLLTTCFDAAGDYGMLGSESTL